MNYLKDLDTIIEQAVSDTFTKDEKERQVIQSKKIDKARLRASDGKKNEVEEAEDEEGEDPPEEETTPEDEEAEKLTGDPEKEPQKKDEETPGTQTSKKLRDPSKRTLKQAKFKDIANNINLMRGGKSIKDPGVRKNLKAYIDKLNDNERQDVLVYLNSLAQVLAGVKTGAEAEEPTNVKKAPKAPPKKAPTPAKSDVIVVGAS